MNILIINKFLHQNGGSETYIFELGGYLAKMGHNVQYFGMEHRGRVVGNAVGAYTSDMDFHNARALSKLSYSFRTIYSTEARRQIRKVLENFQPDVCHLNNFHYQLTPSVILEIVKWRKARRKPCRIVMTAHDYQLVCPNHTLRNPNNGELCEKCLGGRFTNCLKGKCIHGSRAKSAVGMLEAMFWNRNGVYRFIDRIICPSEFLKSKLDTNPILAERTIMLRNFIRPVTRRGHAQGEYVLYFGRLSEEKGIRTLLQACRELPEIPFLFAGTGPLEAELSGIPNLRYIGFQTGDALEIFIRGSRFVVYPSEWYENCPLSVMESQSCGTSVLGADIGGIPELIDDGVNGRLFKSGDSRNLAEIIRELWNHPETVETYRQACGTLKYDGLSEYYSRIMKLYQG